MRELIILCFTILFLPLSVAAEGADLTVVGGTPGTDYKYEDNTCTILTGTQLTISGTTTTDNIVVGENVAANIIFKDLSIKFNDGNSNNGPKGTCAFYIYKKANVTITINKNNIIQSGTWCAGIQIEKEASITILGDGTLTAQGGWGGAGIGAGRATSCGTININSGTVNAFSGDWAFGLGGGCFLKMEPTTDAIININGGIVSAGGTNWASSNINGTININGGKITISYHSDSSYKHDFNGPLTITGGTFNKYTFDNETTIKGGTFANCTFNGETTIKGGTFTNCTFNGEITIKGGTFTNCTLNKIISFDETNASFSDCNLTFTNPATLTKDYSGCTFNGEIRIKSGTFTNCTFKNITSLNEDASSFTTCELNFKEYITLTKNYNDCTLSGNMIIKGSTISNKTLNGNIIFEEGTFTNSTFTGEITVKNGTFTNCIFDGKVFLYNGSSSGNSSVKGSDCYIYDGNWTFEPTKFITAINSTNVYIYGGTVKASGGQNCAGIGGNNGQKGKNVTIYGGYVIAKGSLGAGIGGGDGYSGGGQGGTTIIYGGTVVATGKYGIGGGRGGGGGLQDDHGTTRIYGGSIKGTIGGQPITTDDQPVYLGKLEVQNVTDVSVDDKPYYIDQNIDGDDNLYLYMTGSGHTVTVRTSGSNKVTTYNATYVPQGVDSDGAGKGYFTFDSGSSSTPSDNSSVALVLSASEMIYGTDMLKVTLIVTNKATKTRSAAMNSVQLALTDGTTVLLSDQKDVTKNGEYKFEFDTKKLNAGTYKLTAQYGGSSESLISSEVSKDLVIKKAEGTKASDYYTPSLTAIYGQTLADVTLPSGWTWDSPSESVGNVGTSNSFAAIFTPADTKNYNTVQENLSVNVNPAPAANPGNPVVISPSSVTYGATLSDITITSGWTWEDKTIIPTVTNSGYVAYHSVTDYTNYNWGSISGYNPIEHRVERTIIPTVNLADLQASDFTFTAPDNLIYDGNNKTAKVEAKAGMTGVGTITIKYYKDGTSVSASETKAPGTYTVKIDVDKGDNYNKANELTDSGWTFTIIKKQYNITIASQIMNGTITADKTMAAEDETVTLTVSPDKGYELESLSYIQLSDGVTVPITNKTFIMPESDVTVTATFKKATVTPPDPVDPTPPVDPDPSPVHYTVTLPAVEGATTDPSAGSHKVKKSDDFSFSLIVQEGYRKNSVPVVVTARGEMITPRVSDGKYILPDVRNDVDIEIAGIVPDDDTANVPLPSGFRITATDGILRITAPYATRLYLIDTSGRLILARPLPTGDTRIEGLAAGAYIVTLEDQKGKKILLK